MLLSLAAPIVLVVLSKEAARHATVWALRILVPTFVVGSASLTAQGEHGFLSNSLGVLTGCFLPDPVRRARLPPGMLAPYGVPPAAYEAPEVGRSSRSLSMTNWPDTRRSGHQRRGKWKR